MSLSAHQSSRAKSVDYLTPPEILQPLGTFDFDPAASCSQTHGRINPMCAEAAACKCADGFNRPWQGRIWLNPPFGADAARWLKKLAQHGNGIALIPARTETKMFYESVWGEADAVCFVKGRPHFIGYDGNRLPFNSGAPICLVAYGGKNTLILADSDLGFVARARWSI